MDQAPFTKITIEIRYPDDYRRVTTSTNSWGCTLPEMYEMFNGLLVAAGWVLPTEDEDDDAVNGYKEDTQNGVVEETGGEDNKGSGNKTK